MCNEIEKKTITVMSAPQASSDISPALSSLVSLYISKERDSLSSDSDIVENLLTCLSREQMESLGYADLVRDYFNRKNEQPEAPPGNRVCFSEMRVHTCPQCFEDWVEYVDADQYPICCPHCGAEINGRETGGALTKMTIEPTVQPTTTLWCRLGATLSLTAMEADCILGNEENADFLNIIHNVLSEGRFRFDGDSYVPAPVVEDYNREHGTSYEVGDIDFTI